MAAVRIGTDFRAWELEKWMRRSDMNRSGRIHGGNFVKNGGIVS
jgi:acyl-CoA hydrolase